LGGDPPPLFAGAGFDASRISIHDSGREAIGFESPADRPVIIIERPEEVASGLYILPRADRIDGSEPSPRFLRSADGIERVDEFDDELSLVAVLPEGLAVVTGCAHRGIVNIVESARLAFPGAPIKALVGGFHLVDAPEEELSRIGEGLAALEPGAVYCSHCTGLRGFSALSSALPSKVAWLSCGMRISL
jgi:7,8-dihydropterin-6-yl-methyl-4-(beta-D-ribofuranosyl)aminobenzene 5'-phosphate synthase